MTSAADIIADVASDIEDTAYETWSQDDHLAYLNAAENLIAVLKPDSYNPDLIYQLQAGTRQQIPDGTATFLDPDGNTLPRAIEVIRFGRNMGSDGETPGADIKLIAQSDMDEACPDWRSDIEDPEIIHAIFDKNDRRRFEVYPPQPSSGMGWMELIATAIPTPIEKDGDSYDVSINLGDEYLQAIRAYMKFRAYGRDAKWSQFAAQRALDAWNLFVTMIGRKDLIEKQLPAMRGQNVAGSQTVSK
jgi:hypothetical protein